MTCIVGLVQDNTVYIGADSVAIGDSDTIMTTNLRKDAKVFKNGEFLIAGVGSFRMIDILKYSFEPKISKKVDLDKYMRTEFIDGIRALFKEKGFGNDMSDDGEQGGTFLIGIRGRLFTIHDDYQVAENLEPYSSCGIGEPFALGSLFSTKDFKINAEEKVKMALAAAAYHSGGVRAPFIIMSI